MSSPDPDSAAHAAGTPPGSQDRLAGLERALRLVAGWMGLALTLVVLAAAWPQVGRLPTLYIAEEMLKPAAFAVFLCVVMLTNSFTVLLGRRGLLPLGILVDLVFVAIFLGFAATYVHEIAIEKAFVFPEWLRPDVDPMMRVMTGQPVWVGQMALLASLALLVMILRVWGLPLVIVAGLAGAYALFCAYSSMQGWFQGNVFLSYDLAARDPWGEIRKYLVTGDNHSLLGQFVAILLRIVLPFILLGSVFAATGGGRSLIKLAFVLTRKTRGGPAHAAVVSSSLFGTISGGPVVNVLATGVLTIPMMLRRGFTPRFSGAVEASASSGGQIMPPVMGVAAFFLANYTGVAYSLVVLAALIPALLYFLCLFMSVSFEARRLGIEPIGELPPEALMTRQDWLNLVIVFGPLAIIIAVLATEAFSVTAAGIFALLALMPLSFLDAEVRRRPAILFEALCNGAIGISRIFLIFMAVAIVDSALNSVGFPNAFGAWLADSVSQGVSIFGILLTGDAYLMVILLMTMLASLVLGMGMPTLPAYANVAIVMGASLTGLGLSLFTANMFVFYFAVASAITPPVAVGAFAAASVTGADPMRTAISAVRVGVSIFIVPFAFVFYPELLVIEPAFIADSISGARLEERPDGFDWAIFASILPRMVLAIYLLSSGLSGFDARRMPGWEIVARVVLGLLVLAVPVAVHAPAVLAAVALVALHYMWARRAAAA
ncbi:MAG: TRAP transporter fused permease subunit [Rhodobacteraceae bacterium]|nr:TRAP transporter fused permease subunit [Paracoccaceae bacterium]